MNNQKSELKPVMELRIVKLVFFLILAAVLMLVHGHRLVIQQSQHVEGETSPAVLLWDTNPSPLKLQDVHSRALKRVQIAPVEIAKHSVVVARTNVTYYYPKARFEKPADILVGVLSTAAEGFPMRQVIRETWGRNGESIFFVIAGDWTFQLIDEMRKHQDLFWIEKPETYRNLVFKTLTFLAAAHNHATQFRYLFKTDDDVYFRQDLLERAIDTNQSDYMGSCLPNSPIIRDPEHRWYVREEDYPNATVFRPYAIGAGYALSQELVKSDCFAKHLASIPLFPIEDVSAGEVASRCGAFCAHFSSGAKALEEILSERSQVIALHDIKFPALMKRQHVEYCLDYPNSSSCRGYNTSCADPIHRSRTCHTERFVSCGSRDSANACARCPLSPWKRRLEVDPEEWCHGDCHWCPNGIFGDGLRNKTKAPLKKKCVGVGFECRNHSLGVA